MATPLPALALSAMAGANISVGGGSFPDTGNTRHLAILNKGF